MLAEEADKAVHRSAAMEPAHQILCKWADLDRQGHLQRKETAVDAEFLTEVFGQALGYSTGTDSPEEFHLDREFTVGGAGVADGALGRFAVGQPSQPLAVIELKGAETDLDRDRSGGRTAVQQCWGYLNHLPRCPWGIVSNYSTIRLYHREHTPQRYEQFTLQELREPGRFRQFYFLFERGGLINGGGGIPPRALALLEKSENRQRQVGDDLYRYYSDNRYRLIEHLQAREGKSRQDSIHIAQKLIDRIIFVAFCEDRGLIPDHAIRTTYQTIPPFTKVTNPRWRNFLDLFQSMDQGHARHLVLGEGFNGGLFRRDELVDELQLGDEWTEFFRGIGEYDFRDEVNVDLLGHLFERSVTELERLRHGPLFGSGGGAAPESPVMPKSRERKTLGTYYTPPELTRLLVRETVDALVDERFADLRERHGVESAQLQADTADPALAAYWRDCYAALQEIKVCDPACGSGAFLIQAYDALEIKYREVVSELVRHEGPRAEALGDPVPDLIVAHNLYGVDLSEQAVEITQLALWLRTARRGRTLADLSGNILRGNSLVSDPRVHEQALDWRAAFPAVFGRVAAPGFDAVIGNPPWERIKLQEREFFSLSAPQIAAAVSAADRRRMIAELETGAPELFAEYRAAQRAAEVTLEHVRESGEFPLTGKGDVNTYMLFAELARKIVSPGGRVGLLVPSGIATDATTREFFTALVDSKSLICLYDFENKRPFFADVHRSFKFCSLVFGGRAAVQPAADYAFFLREMEDLDDRDRHIRLSAKDFKLLNPNTRTCPIFRSRRDAELTRGVYQRVPILIDHNRRAGGNPWGIRFATMFHQTNDAELFLEPSKLKKRGARLDGNRWLKGKQVWLPLYEAKMVQAYDHRAAGVIIAAGNWVRQGQTEKTTLVDHQNPEFTPLPRWWVNADNVAETLGDSARPWYLCYKDITSPTNQRTMIAAFIPHVAVVNSAPLVLVDQEIRPRQQACLLANLNSFVLDFIARQKVGNVHLNFFIVEQLPLFPPDRYDDRCPWDRRVTLERWISDRVLHLTCTADDMRPLAEAAGFDPPVRKWQTDERARLMAELDAAYLLLYGIGREDAEYILSTFAGTAEPDDETPSMFRDDHLILEAWDRLSQR